MKLKYYVDGSSPKEEIYTSAYCVFEGNRLIKSKVFDRKIKVYEIEFMALMEGLKLAEIYSIIYSDNKQVVDEINLKRNPANKEFFKNAIELIKEKNLKVEKINRKDNNAGIYLDLRLKKLIEERERVLHPKPNPKLKKIQRKKLYLKGRK